MEALRRSGQRGPGRGSLAAPSRLETVGDLDFVATAADPERVMEAFVHLPQVSEVRLHGPTRSTITTTAGFNVDLRIVPAESFGSLLQHSTGSKAHNIRLRELAQRRGVSISEYGITDADSGDRLLAAADECEVYAFLDLPCIPRSCARTAASSGGGGRHLPPGAGRDRGDLRPHSYSDGACSVGDGRRAQALSYNAWR